MKTPRLYMIKLFFLNDLIAMNISLKAEYIAPTQNNLRKISHCDAVIMVLAFCSGNLKPLTQRSSHFAVYCSQSASRV